MSDGERFDVVVVGARCAGAPLAAMLARRGIGVCLLDRAEFPSETLSTHVIQPCGADILERIGVLDALLAGGAVPIEAFTLVAEDARVEAQGEIGDRFGRPGICMRRVTLDHLLVAHAAAAGADVRTGTRVTEVLRDNGRVTGVRTERATIRAALVVGADGRRSTVAAAVGAAEYHVAPPGRLFSWAYFEGVDDAEPRLRLGRIGTLAFLACPTDGGLYMVGVCPPIAAKDAFLATREESFAAGLAHWPELAALLGGATRAGPIRVMANWHGYFREAAGPGWALLGDAGHFKDPTPAQGISDALRHGEHLAAAIEAGLAGGAGVDEELARWWRWRDEDGREMHWFATDLGGPGRAPPLQLQVLREIAGDEAATERLLRVLNHELLPSEVFTPRLLARAAARLARERPRELPAMLREVTAVARTEARRGRAMGLAPCSTTSDSTSATTSAARRSTSRRWRRSGSR